MVNWLRLGLDLYFCVRVLYQRYTGATLKLLFPFSVKRAKFSYYHPLFLSVRTSEQRLSLYLLTIISPESKYLVSCQNNLLCLMSSLLIFEYTRKPGLLNINKTMVILQLCNSIFSQYL